MRLILYIVSEFRALVEFVSVSFSKRNIPSFYQTMIASGGATC